MTPSIKSLYFSLLLCISFFASVHAGIQTRIPLGPMGAEADLTVNSPELIVKSVASGSPAANAGLQTGDVILGVNGIQFEHYVGGSSYSGDTLMGGEGSTRRLGLAIDKAEGGDGEVILSIRRGTSSMNLTVNLPKVGSFSSTFPYNCPKSEALYSAVANRIIATQLTDGTWPGGLGGDWAGPTRRRYTSSWLGLVLLGKNDPAYRPAINKVKDYLLQPDFKCFIDDDFTLQNSWVDNWGHVMAGIYLCEYVRITGDNSPAILGGIKRISDLLTFRVLTAPSPNPGHMAHSYGGDYGGSGINIINTQAHIFWALAEDLGIQQDDTKIALSLNHVKNSISGLGGVMYTRGDSDMDSGARSGAFAIALHLMGDEAATLSQVNGFLGSRISGIANAHANSSFGIAYSAIAMHQNSPEDFRKFMDEWRWWFALSRKQEGWSGYIGGRGNVGGDGYLGFDSCGLFQIGTILACKYGNLKIGGVAHTDHFAIQLQQPASSRRYVIVGEGLYFKPTFISYGAQPISEGDVTTVWSKISGPGSLQGVITGAQNQSLRFDTPGDYKIRLSATYGSRTLHRDFNVEVLSSPASATSLTQWSNSSVGDQIGSGGFTVNGEMVQLSGSTGDLWGKSDDFYYRYKRLRGDCSITVKIDSFSATHEWARAGIMMRKSLDDGSTLVLLGKTRDRGDLLQSRLFQDGGSGQSKLTETSPWFRLVRKGFGVHAFVSSDGNLWTWVGTRPLLASDEIYVGIVGSSITTSNTMTAVFSNIATEGAEPYPVPVLEINAPSSSAGELFVMEGTLHADWSHPSGGAIHYRWTQVSGPANAQIFTPENLQTTVKVTLPGSYTFRLIGDDGYHAGAKEATVQVTAVGTYTLAKAIELDGEAVSSTAAIPWRVDLLKTSDGQDAAISPSLGANQSSTLTATINAPSASTLRFRWMASTESYYDAVRFFIDGTELATLSGEQDWTLIELPLASGSHTLTWTYSTDAFGTAGANHVGVDQVEIISQSGLASALANAVGLPSPVDGIGGNSPWQTDSGAGYPSGDSIRSGLIKADETSSFSVSHSGAGPVTFVWKVSSEEDADFLEFLVDGSVIKRISGNRDWHEFSTSLGTGNHTLQWRYVKDGSVSRYQDAGWVDNINFNAPTGNPVATRTELPTDDIYTQNDPSTGSSTPPQINGSVTYSPVVSVKNISFGGTPSGTSVDATLIIQNLTNSSISVSSYSTLPPQLSFVNSPIGTIAANGSVTVKVRFSPSVTQTYSGSFSLTLSNGVVMPILWKGLGTATGDLILKPDTVTANLGYGYETIRLITIANLSGEEKQWSLSQHSGSQPTLNTTLASFNNAHARISELISDRYDFIGGDAGNSLKDASVGLHYDFNYLNTSYGSSIPYSDDTVANHSAFGASGSYFTRKKPGLLLFAADVDGSYSFNLSCNLGYNSNQTHSSFKFEKTVAGKTYRGIVRSSSAPDRPTVHQLLVTDSTAGTFSAATNNNGNVQLYSMSGITRIYGLTFMQDVSKTMSQIRLKVLFDTLIETLITGKQTLTPVVSSGSISPGQHIVVPVKIDTTGLDAGTHHIPLHLISEGGGETSQFDITVAASDISVSVENVFINTAPSTSPQPFSLNVSGTASSWAATSSEPWVKVTPTGVSLPAQLDISFINPPITPGQYKIKIWLTTPTSRKLVTLYYSVVPPYLTHLIQDYTRPYLYGLGLIEGKSYLIILSSLSGEYLNPSFLESF